MYNKQCTYTKSLKQTGIKQVVLHLVTTKCIPVLLLWPWSLSTYQGRTALTRLRCYSFPDEVV